MDSNLHSPPPDNDDAKTAFRKPSNDTASRKYRRHSPASGSSSSSDGSPKRGRSFSPINKREGPAKVSDHWHRKKDDGKKIYRDSGRGQYGRRGDSYRHSDRQSSRGSHSYRRHDDYRDDRYADEEERNYHKLSSRYGRDSIDGTRSDKQDGEHNRSRDYVRNVTKYSRDKYDGVGHKTKDKEMEDQKYKERDASSEKAGSGRRHTNSNDEEIKSGERDTHMRDGDGRDEKKGHRGSVEDRKTDRTLYYESRGHRGETALRKDTSGHHLKEAHKSDSKESDSSKDPKEEKRKYDDWDRNRSKDRCSRELGEQYEDKAVFVAGSRDSLAKKHKLSSLGKGTEYGKDADAQETVVKVTPEQAHANESESSSDINAAKVAAMKAAELVNRNLVGVGVLSADQKKKLLWGNKKNTAVEQSGHRWDTALFSDRERQEKFNKLMGVKGEIKVEANPEKLAEKEKELQLDLEKQYTAGLRRRDGRTVGLGL